MSPPRYGAEEAGLSPSTGVEAKSPSAMARGLTRISEACVALAVLLPTFAFGGRCAIGQLLLTLLVLAATGSTILTLLFARPSGFSLRRAEVVVPLAGLVLCVLTWIPLPANVVRALSPGMARLLPYWGELTQDGPAQDGWRYLSIAPGISREAALLFLLYVLLFWATLATFRTPESIRRLLVVFFVTGILVAGVGLLHYLFWNGKFYGLWEPWWAEPDRHVRVPFTNRNHFAGFLALTIAPGLMCLARLLRRPGDDNIMSVNRTAMTRLPAAVRTQAWELTVLATVFGLALILAAILLSQSRTGTFLALLALAATGSGLFYRKLVRHRGLVSIILAGSAGLVLVLVFGNADNFERMRRLFAAGQSWDQLSNRRLWLWKADLCALVDFPLVGCGAGTHRYVYPLYLEGASHTTFTHAENCYLQVLMECGLAGALLLGFGIVRVCAWGLGGLSLRRRDGDGTVAACSIAVGVGLLIALLHAVVDFVWYVPAYAAALAVLCGLAWRLHRLRTSVPVARDCTAAEKTSLCRRSALMLGGCLASAWVALVIIAGNHFAGRVKAESAWYAYYRLLPPANGQEAPAPAAESLEHRRRWLAEACRFETGDPEPFYRLGLAEEQLFLMRARLKSHGVGVAELRQAAQLKDFANPSEAESWLKERYGDDVSLLQQAQAHFRQALRHCPLLGPAYLELADLTFLDEPRQLGPDVCCRQALLVRPNDPAVCLQAGMESWFAGEIASAREYWDRACRLQPSYQARLLPALAAELPAEAVQDVVPLDFNSLTWLAGQELDRGRVGTFRFLVEEAHAVMEANAILATDCRAWVELYALYSRAGDLVEAENCLRSALRHASGQAALHVQLIRCLLEQGKRTEALEQTRKAQERLPESPELQTLRRDILNKAIQ